MGYFIPVILIIFIVPIIILTLILLYKLLYKRHVNHALNSESGSVHYIEPFNFVIILLLVVITIFSVITYTNQKQENQNLNNNINNLKSMFNSNINSLSSKISQLERKLNEMEEASKWITGISSSYDFNQLLDDNTGLMVKINFSLKTSEKDSIIALVIIDKATGQSERVNLESSETLAYSKDVKLSIDKNYSIEVIQESGRVILKEKILDINFKDQLSNRAYFKTDTSNIDSTKEFTLHIFYDSFKIEAFKLANVTYNLYSNGTTLIQTKDITSKLVSSNGNYLYHGTIDANVTDEIHIELIITDKTGRTINAGIDYIYINSK